MFNYKTLSAAAFLALSVLAAAAPGANGTDSEALSKRSPFRINLGNTANVNVAWVSGDSKCDHVILSNVRFVLVSSRSLETD